MRVLVIEDNEDHASLILTQLTPSTTDGTHARASSVRAALRDHDLSAFDVILSDLSLPDTFGLETVRQLRTHATDVPLVVLTSLADDHVALQALEVGAQDYLVKEDILSVADGAHRTLQRTIGYAIQRHEAASDNRRLLRDLQDSKKLLEDKNRRLEQLCDTAEQFVDDVSHEFRTPLTVIKEYASLIRDGIVGEVNAEQQRMLNVIEDRGSDLNTMVDDMLDVSKLRAGLLSVWRRETDLSEVVGHVMPDLERKALVRGVLLETAFPQQLPVVCCDAEKVGRVIINLAVNAIKFCGQPGVVRLWARADDDRRELVIGVTDNGPGIPQDQRERLFARFSQLETAPRQSTKGYGLGLSISRELVDLNLGQMSVQSEPDQGSTFQFTLPYAEPIGVFTRYVSRMKSNHDESAALSFVAVVADRDKSDKDLDDLDSFLSQILRRNDVVFRASRASWLVVLLVPHVELVHFIDGARDYHAELSRNRPFGPLPDLEFIDHGSRYLAEPAESLLECFSDFMRTEVSCHV